MASVWQAAHLSLDTDVAIKFLEPRWSASDDVRARFAREATAIARIKSPHVVQVLDYGFTERGHGFIVMELLQGEDLGRRLAQRGRLGLAETLTIVGQACRGLGKAHAANIVHRDIKPENLFLTQDDEGGVFVKLLDFGVAKAVGVEDTTHQTDTGQIVGTPLYMSPEQALGRNIDSRCDLYSLVTVAYRCLTGRAPFVQKHVGGLLVAISTSVPPRPSTFEPSLPSSVDDWFASMFAKDPDARCAQNVRELAASFEAACSGSAMLTPVLATVTATSVDAPTEPGDPDGRRAREPLHGRDTTPAAGLERGSSDTARAKRGRTRLALMLMIVLGAGVLVIAGRQRVASEGGATSASGVPVPERQPVPVEVLRDAVSKSVSEPPEQPVLRDAAAAVLDSDRTDEPAAATPTGAAAPAARTDLRPQSPAVAPRAPQGAAPVPMKRKRGGAEATEPPPAQHSPREPSEEHPQRKRTLELDRSSPWRTP